MTPSAISSLITAGILLALACGFLAWHSRRLRQRIEQLEAACRAHQDATGAWTESSALRQDQLAASWSQLELHLRRLEHQVEDLARTPRTTWGPDLNLTQRLRVIRMSQRGETASHISAVLNIPLAEVELIIKLYPLTLVSYS